MVQSDTSLTNVKEAELWFEASELTCHSLLQVYAMIWHNAQHNFSHHSSLRDCWAMETSYEAECLYEK